MKNKKGGTFIKPYFLHSWANWKNILRKWLSKDVLSKVHLNKYGSHFKFVLLSSDINMNTGPTTPKRNDILWELFHFHNCSFSTEWIDYQLDPLSVVTNDACNIFQKRGMHFIHLNINSFLPKSDEISYIAKLTNATVIGLSENKLGNTVWAVNLKKMGITGKIWPVPKRSRCSFFC